MNQKLSRFVLDFIYTLHPEYTVPSQISCTDDITKIIQLNSLEWMVLISEIEQHFHFTIKNEQLKNFSLETINEYIEKNCPNA